MALPGFKQKMTVQTWGNIGNLLAMVNVPDRIGSRGLPILPLRAKTAAAKFLLKVQDHARRRAHAAHVTKSDSMLSARGASGHECDNRDFVCPHRVGNHSALERNQQLRL